MIRYKLTDQNMRTHGKCKWAIGLWKKTSGSGDLCGPGWLHCYDSPEIALLLNPCHADIKNPRLWKCECAGKTKNDSGAKRGYSLMRIVEEIELPKADKKSRVRFAMLCAKEVYTNKKWNTLAAACLSGSTRTTTSAWKAAAKAAAGESWSEARRSVSALFASEWTTSLLCEAQSHAAAAAKAAAEAALCKNDKALAVRAARSARSASRSMRKMHKEINLAYLAKKAMEKNS